MATAWTLTAEEVITDALMELGVLGAGQTASPTDYDMCLRALQNVLKEMPLHGPLRHSPGAAIEDGGNDRIALNNAAPDQPLREHIGIVEIGDLQHIRPQPEAVSANFRQ